MSEEFKVKDIVVNIVSLLDELENFENDIPNKQSSIDTKISDLYHLLESEKLKVPQLCRFTKKLKTTLEERRMLKEQTEMMRTLNTHKAKFNNIANRQMLLSELGKMEKQLNSEYKYRVLSEDEINEILGISEGSNK